MKIVYNDKDDLYNINLEYPETELYIVGKNIEEVKKRFIDMMISLFDDTIKNSLKDSF